MRKSLLLLSVVPLAAIMALSGPSQAAETLLQGEVFYRERIALPENAVLKVQLADVSLADAWATVIAEQEINPAGQVPIKFQISFDSDIIKPNMTYALQARITIDDKLLFINQTRHTVDPLTTEPQSILVNQAHNAQPSAATDSLFEAEWVLEYLDGVEGVPGRRPATMQFTKDGGVNGQGPCNRYFGAVKLDGSTLSFGPAGATQMACDEASMKAEQALFQGMERVVGFNITDGKLHLLDAEGNDVMRFALPA